MTNIPTDPTRPDSRAVHAEAHLLTSALIRTACGAEAARQYFAHHGPLVEMVADTAVLLYDARFVQDGPTPSNDRVSALASRELRTNCVIDDDPARHGDKMWGWPVVALADLHARSVRDVLVSSWIHRAPMAARCEAAGLHPHTLYTPAPAPAVTR